MKKRKILFGLCAFSAVLGLAACKGDDPVDEPPVVEAEQFTITFNSNGGSAIASKKAKKDEKITNPGAPTREGYTFDGWFKDAACTLPWNFATDVVTGDVTLYAKWTKKDTPTPPTPTEKYSVTYVINGHGEQPDNLADQTKLPDTLP
ncbi:MAG: InlB B-repeat-containing protein, partial [Anaeroplasmataceae bacterium]|nr:InlB B-repeat-containing protein [Anaeroplasmataceae bacterium]